MIHRRSLAEASCASQKKCSNVQITFNFSLYFALERDLSNQLTIGKINIPYRKGLATASICYLQIPLLNKEIVGDRMKAEKQNYFKNQL